MTALCFWASCMSVSLWGCIGFLHVGLCNLMPALCVLAVSGVSALHCVTVLCVPRLAHLSLPFIYMWGGGPSRALEQLGQ